MEVKVNDIFNQGPAAVESLIHRLKTDSPSDEMDVKHLADICWTRASSLGRALSKDAREWVLAALAGYEYLSRHAKPAVARSAAENAAALRAWPLLNQKETVA